MSFRSVNPATGTVVAEYEEMRAAEIAGVLERADRASRLWRSRPHAERAAPVREAVRLLREAQPELADLMAREMGKPLGEGRAEVEKCAWVGEYYAEHAARFLAPEIVETGAARSYVTFEPLGVVLAIMPWNFPLWQVLRCAVPALLAGNAVILKHSPNVTGCALAIERLLAKASLPADLFRTVIAHEEAVASMIEHPAVKAVTLTGSARAGRAVAAKAGAMLKKVVLELGGSDPYVILEDAELDSATELCVTSRMINAGQSCIAAKRILAHHSQSPEVEKLLVERMRRFTVGDPLDPSSQIGPLARGDLRDELHRQVAESVGQGARCLLGGAIPEGPGFFYPPTVLAGVREGMPAWDEELFGPVAVIIPFSDEEEAIRIANDNPYGLGAAVFTRDVSRGEEIARTELEAGSCFVNDFVRSDPRLPFGGVKQSGFGRELGPFGIREFVNVKTICIA